MSNDCTNCFQVGVLKNFQNGMWNSKAVIASLNVFTAFNNVSAFDSILGSKHPSLVSSATIPIAKILNYIQY